MSEAVNTAAEVGTSAELLEGLWDEVVGQPQLVEELRAAAEDPVQAYLFVGPPGSGKRSAATAFAAELVSSGLDEPAARRAVSLASAELHPSVQFVERDDREISKQARALVAAAARTPPEGDVQVFILDDHDFVVDLGPRILKAIEEPESATVFLILVEGVPEELITIASRCARYPVPPVDVVVIQERLEEAGVDPVVATEAARSAEGSLRRARLLAGDPELVVRREAWRTVPARLDGTGATVGVLCDELLGSVESVLEPLLEIQAQEVEALAELTELTGKPARASSEAMEKRHKRESRRLRTGELAAGTLALLGSYRQSAINEGGDAIEQFGSAARLTKDFVMAINSNAVERLAMSAMLVGLDQG